MTCSRFTEEEFKKILKRGHCKISGSSIYKSNCGEIATIKNKKQGRTGSLKIELDGHLFASKSEAEIYSEFKIDPEVTILKLQPRFVLLSPFKRKNKTIRGITYTSDFKIEERGREIIVEVKSEGTLKANSKSYPIRRKLFLNQLSEDIIFREIIFDKGKRTVRDY